MSSPVRSPGLKARSNPNGKSSSVAFGRTIRADDSMKRPSRADRVRADPSSSASTSAAGGGIQGGRSARSAAAEESDRQQLSRHLFQGHLAARPGPSRRRGSI
jgi:hypothetical protein